MKKFYSSSEQTRLKEQATFVFEELSDGIYLVVKDRYNKYNKYVSSEQVFEALNHISKVVVVNRVGINGYANWDFN